MKTLRLLARCLLISGVAAALGSVAVAETHKLAPTPRTVTWPTGGSGRARTIRSSVDRLTPIPSRVASREPARPTSANAMATSAA